MRATSSRSDRASERERKCQKHNICGVESAVPCSQALALRFASPPGPPPQQLAASPSLHRSGTLQERGSWLLSCSVPMAASWLYSVLVPDCTCLVRGAIFGLLLMGTPIALASGTAGSRDSSGCTSRLPCQRSRRGGATHLLLALVVLASQ